MRRRTTTTGTLCVLLLLLPSRRAARVALYSVAGLLLLLHNAAVLRAAAAAAGDAAAAAAMLQCCNACCGCGSAAAGYVRVACLYAMGSSTLVSLLCLPRLSRRALCLLFGAAIFRARVRCRRGRWLRFLHDIKLYLRRATRRHLWYGGMAFSSWPNTKTCTPRTDHRIPLQHDLDISGQIYFLICTV